MIKVKKIASDPNQLRDRVSRYFSKSRVKDFRRKNKKQLKFEFSRHDIDTQWRDISHLLDYLSDICVYGDIYIYGGMLRDIALLGIDGFTSDIDLVVESDWETVSKELFEKGGELNKFGGMRIAIDGLDHPIDIWDAKNTWAFKNNYLVYRDISSLLDSTMFNWDSILMCWKTKSIVHSEKYFEDLNNRHLDLVFAENPNPIGMLVRAFRHILNKDALSASDSLINYLVKESKKYSFSQVYNSERASYLSEYVIENNQYHNFRNGISSRVLQDLNNQENEFSGQNLKNKISGQLSL